MPAPDETEGKTLVLCAHKTFRPFKGFLYVMVLMLFIFVFKLIRKDGAHGLFAGFLRINNDCIRWREQIKIKKTQQLENAEWKWFVERFVCSVGLV